MISAQIDELRKWADQLSERENEFGVVVRALVASLREAADTIWQLRDDLQRSNAENAKLRKLASELWVSCPVHDSDCDECKHKGGRTGCELYDRMLELGVTA